MPRQKMTLQSFTLEIIPLREKLYRYALRVLKNIHEAEDNVQETFLRLWLMRMKLPEYRNVAALAMQINKNLCYDKLRARKNTTGLETLQGVLSKPADKAMEEKQTIEMVQKIINTLPALQQLIMKMRDMEGYEIEEIASITGARAEAVRMNLSRARQKVREMMRNY
jgi:RNA polymerase sigma-70 factor (ECF subfamily)